MSVLLQATSQAESLHGTACQCPRRWSWCAHYEQNPQSARRNNFPGEQISRWFLLLSENFSASSYTGAAYGLSPWLVMQPPPADRPGARAA
jgi:hypothetical protein